MRAKRMWKLTGQEAKKQAIAVRKNDYRLSRAEAQQAIQIRSSLKKAAVKQMWWSLKHSFFAKHFETWRNNFRSSLLLKFCYNSAPVNEDIFNVSI